jgi:hypothetical protein
MTIGGQHDCQTCSPQAGDHADEHIILTILAKACPTKDLVNALEPPN